MKSVYIENSVSSFGLSLAAHREAAKSSFPSGPATKAFSPPTLGLVATGTFFLVLKKFFFPQWHTRLAPFLVAQPLRKELFLRLPLLDRKLPTKGSIRVCTL